MGNTIFETIATVIDIIAYTNETKKPSYILTIDFKEAFDGISHSFLFWILKEYGISERFC